MLQTFVITQPVLNHPNCIRRELPTKKQPADRQEKKHPLPEEKKTLSWQDFKKKILCHKKT
jgi:hypothetical protein